ncbi:MAG: hypothetical protein OEV40_28655 [Acidimicrobiia bacterium]|nr:hypothetical protein [Acidimicrobiia bacterium]
MTRLNLLKGTFVAAVAIVPLTATIGATSTASAQGEVLEFDLATIGIETGTISPEGEKTDSTDFEIQWFVDYTGAVTWEIQGPNGDQQFTSELAGSAQEQGGSEVTFASQPNHPYDPETYPGETLESFLGRFPEGEYVFTGVTSDGSRVRSTAHLTHDIPAHPEVAVEVDDDEVSFSWRPVTDCFDDVSCDGVEVVEYSVKIEEDDVERDNFVDGGFTNGASRYQEGHYLPEIICDDRRCEVELGTDFFVPGNSYGWQVFAIEESGNSTYRADTFVFPEDERDRGDRDDRRRGRR